MSIETILSKLEKVKRTGGQTWRALCPAHENKKTLTLALREAEDGRILLYCFAGCAALDILNSLGLEFHEVMPPRPGDYIKPLRRPFPAADVLECVAEEAQIVSICAIDLAHGKTLGQPEFDRLLMAASRLRTARTLANG